jgi:hypothetical protein
VQTGGANFAAGRRGKKINRWSRGLNQQKRELSGGGWCCEEWNTLDVYAQG